jgi:AmmeMemoRadiSam system protein B
MLAAKQAGVTTGNLLGYSTSYEKHKKSSFVGYAGILY